MEQAGGRSHSRDSLGKPCERTCPGYPLPRRAAAGPKPENKTGRSEAGVYYTSGAEGLRLFIELPPLRRTAQQEKAQGGPRSPACRERIELAMRAPGDKRLEAAEGRIATELGEELERRVSDEALSPYMKISWRQAAAALPQPSKMAIAVEGNKHHRPSLKATWVPGWPRARLNLPDS